MLIQDMPALATSLIEVGNYSGPPVDLANPPLDPDTVQKEFNRQLEILIQQHKSYPSIVTWVRFSFSIQNYVTLITFRSFITRAGANHGKDIKA